jgi:2-keto-4-pentenoate hydratase/2-oxohepta-3-ene-1,7-dioic acid hydratase in catechol pathway
MVKLTMYNGNGATRSGILVGDHVYDLKEVSDYLGVGALYDLTSVSSVLFSSDGRLQDSLVELVRKIQGSTSNDFGNYAIEYSNLEFAPLLRPQMCHAIGQNYKFKPNRPMYVKDMLKAGSSICANHDRILLPKGLTLTHVSAELCGIISRKAKNLSSLEEAKNVLGGYTMGNDVGAISFVHLSRDMASTCKSMDGFGPMGPIVVTPDEIDPTNVDTGLKINGEQKVSGNTRDAAFSIYEVVRDISGITTLYPGDVIFLGAMGDEPYIKGPGDVVECWGSRIGTLTNEFVAGDWSLSEDYVREIAKNPTMS